MNSSAESCIANESFERRTFSPGVGAAPNEPVGGRCRPVWRWASLASRHATIASAAARQIGQLARPLAHPVVRVSPGCVGGAETRHHVSGVRFRERLVTSRASCACTKIAISVTNCNLTRNRDIAAPRRAFGLTPDGGNITHELTIDLWLAAPSWAFDAGRKETVEAGRDPAR
jgi:hypothetical protein